MGVFTGSQKNLVAANHSDTGVTGRAGGSKPAISAGGVYLYLILARISVLPASILANSQQIL
jgi:hypothetical protein